MKIVFTAGSLRANSLNKKFAQEALRLAKELGHDGEFLDPRDYALPLYDGDDEEKNGAPLNARKLAEKIAAADAVVLATPEYNGGIAGNVKNTLDWLSRLKPMPLADKHLLLLGATPGAMGALRGLWHTRQPFEAVGMHVYPGMMGLGMAGEAFGADGHFADEKKAAQLKELLEKFLKHAGR